MSAHPATARAESPEPVHIGEHLRQWRLRRHLSQLDLAEEAEISTRHLSFVETGRAAPSRDMVLKLAERLNVPLRERNVLLVAAGFAPAFPQSSDAASKSPRRQPDRAGSNAAAAATGADVRRYGRARHARRSLSLDTNSSSKAITRNSALPLPAT